jgi:hypothetical protein
MDITEAIYKATLDHLPFVVGIAIAAWWLFPHLFKRAMSNGGGEIFKGIVEAANTKQSLENEHRIQVALEKHEIVEDAKIEHMLNAIKDTKSAEHKNLQLQIDNLDTRVGHIEGHLDKLNG